MPSSKQPREAGRAGIQTLVFGFLPLPVLLGIFMTVAFYYALLGAEVHWGAMAGIISVVVGVFFLNTVWKNI